MQVVIGSVGKENKAITKKKKDTLVEILISNICGFVCNILAVKRPQEIRLW